MGFLSCLLLEPIFLNNFAGSLFMRRPDLLLYIFSYSPNSKDEAKLRVCCFGVFFNLKDVFNFLSSNIYIFSFKI